MTAIANSPRLLLSIDIVPFVVPDYLYDLRFAERFPSLQFYFLLWRNSVSVKIEKIPPRDRDHIL